MKKIIISLFIGWLLIPATIHADPVTFPDIGRKIPFSITNIKPDGVAVHNLNIKAYAPSGKTYYVNVTNGKDTNTGLTSLTAFKTMNKALMMSDIVVMRVSPGNYYWNYGITPKIVNKSLAIISEGGQATISYNDMLKWEKTIGTNNTYQAKRSVAASVWDSKLKDSKKDYTQLIKRNNITEVDSNAGSWYVDGDIVYVRTKDSRPVDNSIKVFLDVDGVRLIGNGTLYLENVDIEGGRSALRVENSLATDSTKLYAFNSTFKYSTSNNGVTLLGVSESILQECVASKNFLDGFNYHIQKTTVPYSIEVDSVSRSNGTKGGSENNGSTMHDGGTIVRVNGVYHGNVGPNIADVNNSKSWNVGVYAFSPKYAQSVNFYSDGLMWLESSTSIGADFDFVSRNGSIELRETNWQEKKITSNGKVTEY